MNDSKRVFLWINLGDLSEIGNVGGIGLLHFLVRAEDGDVLRPGVAMHDSGRIDDVYVLVECAESRAAIITDALNLIASRKIKHHIRLKTTVNPPDKSWRIHIA